MNSIDWSRSQQKIFVGKSLIRFNAIYSVSLFENGTSSNEIRISHWKIDESRLRSERWTNFSL